ncbi:polyketide synthase [Rhodococcus sp. 05-2256-B2]|uniref:polyketide synthase Pks13 n=1 Tax=unclassified Rhodococcus (in: high G+C Gram-positive bacteria) TaxID=192944 RepID=UPI000B9AF6FB|nr:MULTISPECIES: polyketide synthase Pks13 [unclassified Rhodococcus (in: high G+C Gram-positive bacteria)]OZD91096.1 polyketide synthase [Rhodococcus sp. 05-2256-B4]OZD92999.1 polyketide synthase [Rhodococcus sp. 05-2256-B2]OZD95660.1 polyketide synthase [Rhodococcus sp. 05-2256-B3]OZD95914.1 polyketide synthase [Rhodococcus sp. 05-2256-B1]
MAEQETDKIQSADGTDLTVAQLRDWLRNWVADATGQPASAISDDRPMEEFGLSSRDAVALSGEIEELVGVTLTATVVYQHPTIASLAKIIIEGEPDEPVGTVDDAFYTSGVQSGDAHDIAIVGLSSRFPGTGHTPEEMWSLLIEGRDGITDLPEGRWKEFTSDPVIAAAVDATVTKGGYLDDVKTFDAEFFAMSPNEVVNVDPQQRLALELTWEALEHAHIPASSVKGSQVGVFIGSSSNDYQLIAVSDPAVHPYALTGTSTAIVANRVSYFYDFRGPSIAVDTACSSSLVAVHQAVRSLRTGESDLAVAGGVNMLLAPPITVGFGQTGVLAPDGKIKAFSSDANGMIRSEGGGLVVLKRLEDAERDGDQVLAVIAGSAINQDGRSNGLLAPNPDAQADALRFAYRDAGINPSGVDYIEAHGTGTILGDPIEADALGRVVGRGRDADKPALLGSAKTNFGHLESAAGAAGLIKVVLAMQENKLPASLNYVGPNPYIDFDKAHLKVIPEATDWPRYTGKAVAGISGFGFGGTNAHVVVREYVPGETSAEFDPAAVDPEAAVVEGVYEEQLDAETTSPVAEAETILAESDSAPETVILAVSAALPSRRKRAASELADWLETEEGSTTPLVDVGRTLARRNHGRSRAVVLASTTAEAIAGLRAIAAGKPGPGVFSADSPASNGAVWVFSGFGSQHRKMASRLYRTNAVFAAEVDKVDELLVDEAGYSIREIILDDSQTYEFENSQVAIFVIQIALAATLRAHGAEPSAVIGHSMGEVAAAYVAGGLNLEDAVRIIYARSRLLAEGQDGLGAASQGAMALVEYTPDEVKTLTDQFPNVEPCVYAAPTHTTVGGPRAEVEALVEKAEAAGKMARLLDVKGAGHTAAVDVLLGELAAELAGIEPSKLTAGVYSSVDREAHYRVGHAAIHGVDYWTKGMRHPVWFTQAVNVAVGDGHTTFVELAPNPVALMSVAATAWAAGLADATLIPTLKRKEDEADTFLAALAQLYVHGHALELATLFESGPYAAIPRTAYLRKEFWLNSQVSSSGNSRVPGARVALPDGRHVWEVQASAVSGFDALVTAAASQVFSDVALGASVSHASVPAGGTVVTTLTSHLGGASVQVHAHEGSAFTLLHEAVVTSGDVRPEPVVAVEERSSSPMEELPEVVETFGDRWDPNGNQKLEDRLAIIVAESMGYAPEDLPPEVPLIELGLDSLSAVRIKNRVEYEFDIPTVQLQAVRDANLREVEKYLRYAIENRDEVQALADKQAAEKAAEQAAESGATARDEALETAVAAPETAVPSAEYQPAPVVAAQTDLGGKEAFAEAAGSDVPPRDNAERMTFATWAVVTKESAKGIFNTLPILDDETAEKLAARLTERAGGEITFDDVLDSETIEQLADKVRPHLEDGEIDGVVRNLRARPEGSTATPVFAFHSAGSSTVAYEPLLRKLPAGTPMYGLERVEGPIAKRAAEYVPLIKAIQPEGPYVFVGWSLGGILAYEVARQMEEEGIEVAYVGLLDTVMPGTKIPDTKDEVRKRWERYAAFAKKTYNVDYPIPYDKLVDSDDEGQIRIITDLVKLSGAKIPGGIIEHQRTSWLDNRAIQTAELKEYGGHVTLYLADKYHDDAIALEPAYATREEHGGWGPVVKDLEIVYVGGDHLAVVDEPYIGKIAAHLSKTLENIESARTGA